ncbi:MAG: hypothetical protein RAO92_00080 [Candidatus Euphemobacter frigidus]|nr:hypothetical protein [Candidatus Euphemobacter frigidus]MDP8274775.1 hypothetical protein [Candidatus Euphemobacter frigidus]
MRAWIVLILALMLFPVTASADNGDSGIAKVKFRDLKELLLERVFALKGNEGLRKVYRDNQEQKKKSQKKMMEAMKSGNWNPMEYGDEAISGNREDEKKIEELAKAELIRIIEKLYPNKFKLVLDDMFSDNILYTSVLIPDITLNIRQYLIKAKLAAD